MNEEITLIMLVYKDFERTKKCIDSIEINTNIPYKMIIISNDAEKEIQNFIMKRFIKSDKHILIFNKKNKGTTKAFNQALKIADTKYICFINSDYIFTSNWLFNLKRCFETNKDCGLCGAMTNITGNVYEKTPNKKHLINEYRENDIVLNCFFTTKEIMNKINGWTEDYFFGMEDLDLCEKIKKAGYKIFIDGFTFIYHDHNSNKKNDEGHMQMNKSREIFKQKWGEEVAEKYWWAFN